MVNQQLVVVSALAYIVSSISFVCTVITLVLIKVMKKWNGFLAILWAMALCQLIFDISFTRHITSDSSYVSSAGNFTTALWNGLQFFGGLSVSIWTNILAIVVLKVVVTFEAFNIRKNFYFLSAVAMLPPFIICILSMALYKEDATSGDQDVVGTVYSYSRAVSIAINFVCYGIIAVRARKITTATAGEISSQQLLINELSRRMIYYPLMQTVSRIGACVYEPVYGYGPYLGHSSQPEFSWACVYAITAPAAGIGYLVIFLLMQPYAYEQFVSLLTTCKPIPSTGTSVASSQDRRKYSDNSLSDHTNSHKTTSSNGFSDSLARGGSMHSLSRGSTKGNGEARTDSTIQFMDDDELIKAIKDTWKQATRRISTRQSDHDSVSEASISVYSRGSELTSSQSLSSSQMHTASVEMSSVESFHTAMTAYRTSPHV